MRTKYLALVFIVIVASCKSHKNDTSFPDKSQREIIEKEITGTWDLYKQSFRPTETPGLISPNLPIERLEIKADSTYLDQGHPGVWFISYTEKSPLPVSTHIIFHKISYLSPNGWKEYDRTVKSYFLKTETIDGAKYLYFTSLETSATDVYILKK